MMIHIARRYSSPEKRGRSDKPCAIPMVKGLRKAPANPRAAATKQRETPTIES
ncbi:MAG: hypothetical protein BWY89_01647 [Bacteroidetes bacterium ADurb.BinA012]|nr:MAG: hypothetical protein BWY89_01647 [Bacteroidetes bacterium ADurb.BinA012]